MLNMLERLNLFDEKTPKRITTKKQHIKNVKKLIRKMGERANS